MERPSFSHERFSRRVSRLRSLSSASSATWVRRSAAYLQLINVLLGKISKSIIITRGYRAKVSLSNRNYVSGSRSVLRSSVYQEVLSLRCALRSRYDKSSTKSFPQRKIKINIGIRRHNQSFFSKHIATFATRHSPHAWKHNQRQ